jgi:GNAT superfamily N-acetyltransferase
MEFTDSLSLRMSYCKVIESVDWSLIELLETGFPDESPHRKLDSDPEQIMKEHIGDEIVTWYGRYTEDHRLIGCVAMRHEPCLGYDLFSFTIHEHERKHGNGSALLDYVIQTYSNDVIYIYSKLEMIHYYNKFGFKQEVCRPLGQPRPGTAWMFKRPQPQPQPQQIQMPPPSVSQTSMWQRLKSIFAP